MIPGAGSGFLSSTGRGTDTVWNEDLTAEVVGAASSAWGRGAVAGAGDNFTVSGLTGGWIGRVSGARSGATLFNMRILPVSLKVRTGSASAMSCSMFLIGAAGGAGGPMTTRAGGRSTTPCMAGNVREPVGVGEVFVAADNGSTLGATATGAAAEVGLGSGTG